MAAKNQDSTSALVTVVKALEALKEDADRQWVLNSAASRFTLTVQVPAGGGGAAGASPPGSGSVDAQAAIARKDIRAFMRAKKPATDVQRVACLGAYLTQAAGQQGFTVKDIAAANTSAGGSKFNFTRALDNATRRTKYISTISGRDKQLTTLGEDVVDALPDQTAVKAAEEGSKSRRGKKGRKKAAKKTKKA